MSKNFQRTLLASAVLAACASVSAQQAPSDAVAADPATVVVLGSRAAPRSALDTAVPVGLIGQKDLGSTGTAELGKALQELDPSFNFSTTFISDGTDIIRPATLRGLGPDQLLVLVNGKRRHQQALVNVQQTIGRGSAGTDINAIPLSAIHHIEILRDGGAAQYGSDAIAGVINIVLKQGSGNGQMNALVSTTSQGDGKTFSLGETHAWALGSSGGYLDLSLESRRRGETNRAGPDTLRVDPPRVTQHIGDSKAADAHIWVNSALPLGAAGSGGELYAFGGISRRIGDAYGFFRPREDGRNVPEVYPDGFLPRILTQVTDASLALGYRRDLAGGWDLDFSVNHGRSELAFMERNSINVSYWYEPKCPCGSPWRESMNGADTGKLRFNQTTVNLDLRGPLSLAGIVLQLAAGLEYRRDGYQIVAGDPISYQYGRSNDPAIRIFDQNGNIAAAGIQGFPGYTPATEVNAARHNSAVYLDAEHKFALPLTLGVALRHERYSDFGGTTNGKVSLRYDPSRTLGLRASASTGFRAPGVQQKYYSSVSTNLNAAGVLTETLTAREGSPVTRLLGIAPLKQETSRSASLGLVLRPWPDTSVTLDAWRTRIADRIVFSSTIAPESGACATAADCPIRAILDPLRVGQAQFFTNAIDTTTNGLDLVAEKTLRNIFNGGGVLVLSGQLGLNRTSVDARHSSSPVLNGAQLFDDAQVTLIERGQPRKHHVLAADYNAGAWRLNARANYYGEVAGQGFTAPYIQVWEPKWLLDLSARIALSKRLSLTAGVDNVFDTYPTRWDTVRAAPFPQMGFTYCWETCPFGINGRTISAKVDYAF
jgi:iron complex outermembrane receptor protein